MVLMIFFHVPLVNCAKQNLCKLKKNFFLEGGKIFDLYNINFDWI